MTYTPPKHPLEILQSIEFEDAVTPDDPRFVETEVARGSPKTLDRLARKFGLDLHRGTFYPATKRHVLLFGHIGCGKSTELLHLGKKLTETGKVSVVPVDVLNNLDRNNLQYADALMAMVHALLAHLEKQGVGLHGESVRKLENWFKEHVKTEERAKELVAQLETKAVAEVGIPFIAKFVAGFTSAFKTNASYKESLRQVIRNTYSQFAEAFNEFLREAESGLEGRGLGGRVLFIIDGTDKMRSDDTKRFFVEDAEQLLAIDALMLYTAPISLKYEGSPLGKVTDIVLPMIKLAERDGTPFDAGKQALLKILALRADPTAFADAALMERLVDFSGGHPRELLRLLSLCCEFAEDDQIDAEAVERACKALSSDYRRFLEPEDYALLECMDRESEQHGGNDERTRRLLFRLALLEYNDGSWRRSHPAVRQLEGYKQATAKTQPAPNP